MKRVLWIALAVLLLWGCSYAPAEENAPTSIQTQPSFSEPTEPAGIYEAFSDLEIRTEGAVRSYQPDAEDVYGMRLMENDVLLFSGEENTTLTRYTGEKLYPIGRITLDCRVEPEDTAFQIGEHGITFFQAQTHQLIFLDNELKEVRRLELPADMTGKPLLSLDRTQVFYCTADAVRVLDTVAGLDKLLKSISYPRQSATNLLLGDSVLCCELTDDHGRTSLMFLSTRTGELLGEYHRQLQLTGYGDSWYGLIGEGLLEQVIFGKSGQENQVLYPADAFARPWIQRTSQAVITASVGEEETVLDRYDLNTGLRTASAVLPQGMEPWYVESTDQGHSYLLVWDRISQMPVILRWDFGKSTLEDDQNYLGPRYTAENPDVDGIARCAALAAQIGDQYGIEILVGPEAAAREPWDYELEAEYQVSLIQRELEALEQLLGVFPAGFVKQLPGQVKLCLVRSVTGSAASGSLEAARGVQFWEGETAYVAFAPGESLAQTFFHEMFHIIDSKVLSVCRVYYHWENLNPEDCHYFGDYTSYMTADVSQYLRDEDRAFIDAYSLCYPREDRARIMEYACVEGNAHYFQSETMQNKLKVLCEGIRKAFGLEKYQEPLIWEQYLAEPLKMK